MFCSETDLSNHWIQIFVHNIRQMFNIHLLPPFPRPLLPHIKHPQHLKLLSDDPVRNEIRITRNRHLPHPGYPPRFAHRRIVCQPTDRFPDG